MVLREIVKNVESSPEYKKFHKENPDYHLASVFSVGNVEWNVGYYSKKSDKMVTFDTNPIKMNPPDDVFKKEGTVHSLDMTKVKTRIDQVNRICDELTTKKYKTTDVTKKIIILQHHEQLIYNITLLTSTFNVINIRIDASNGNILHDSMSSALSFQDKTA
ncbi:MAG: hypothetical protein KKG59_00770 [Nanoarchaeota archaeon]|nr:hypothetical protein [Nanoarchaeota archaeon]